MAYKFVGIDPGHQTGIVVVVKKLTQTYQVLDHQTLEDDYDKIRDLVDRHDCGTPSVFILESQPYNRPDKPTLILYSFLYNHLRESSCGLVVLSPGTWKPVVKAQGWVRPKGWTRHEIDAYNLIRYHLYTEGVSIEDIKHE